jgi:histidinol-phosphatase (PHP family)
MRPVGMVDLHLHSTCSADGASDLAEYAHRAARRAVDQPREAGPVVLGFCEHVDFDPRDRAYDYLDVARYDHEFEAARRHADGVRFCQGVEITYQAALEDQIRAWLSARRWDYVVASVHLVDYADGWAMVSEARAVEGYFAAHTEVEAYLPYFEEVLRAVRSRLGDVLGHLDLIKRYGVTHYGPFGPEDFEEEIRAVLRALVETGMGLEINTSGWRQAPAEPYPGLKTLRWYRELGGQLLTVGSDAHHVEQMGAGIPEALDLARAAGFRAVAAFEAGQPIWIDL